MIAQLHFSCRRHAHVGGRSAVALILVLVVTVTATILATTYLASQGTSIGIATNVRDHAKARYVAESGLAYAFQYMQENAT